MNVAKILTSRARWKDKAKRRGSTIRGLRKASTAQHTRREHDAANREDVSRLHAELSRLRAERHPEPTALADTGSAMARRTLCVTMVIHGIVSFRAVPRLLAVFLPLLKTLVPIPHFTSVIHWTLRVGVALFNQVALTSGAWIAIIDCSIDVGTRKALVVLRIPLEALQTKGGAVGLHDCECIGLEVSHTWNGGLISKALGTTFERAGYPAAIIKDGGLDLNKGIELLRTTQQGHPMPVIDDIGHYTANALRATFATDDRFVRFLKIVSRGASRIRQTRLAWFLPPKIRSKARFHSITAVATWAHHMLDFLGGPGRAKAGTDVHLARTAFAGLATLRPFLTGFCQIAALCEEMQHVLKTQGLNQATYGTVTKILEQLPDTSLVKTRLLAWCEKHIRLHRALGIGDLRLLVSSDIIESLFGKFKTIIQRNPLAELNRLSYIIPLLCGTHSAADIDHALNACSHVEMLQHIEQTIPQTLRQQRVQELAKRPHAVPKSGSFALLDTS